MNCVFSDSPNSSSSSLLFKDDMLCCLHACSNRQQGVCMLHLNALVLLTLLLALVLVLLFAGCSHTHMWLWVVMEALWLSWTLHKVCALSRVPDKTKGAAMRAHVCMCVCACVHVCVCVCVWKARERNERNTLMDMCIHVTCTCTHTCTHARTHSVQTHQRKRFLFWMETSCALIGATRCCMLGPALEPL